MGRPTKKAIDAEEQVKASQAEAGTSTQKPVEQPKETGSKKEEEVSANILALMKLYPQYEEFYVTPNGFVHPAGAPAYLLKGAKLYKNKFYNK